MLVRSSLIAMAMFLVWAPSAESPAAATGVFFQGTWDGPNPMAAWASIHESYGGGSLTLVRESGRGNVARVTLPAGGEAAIEAIHHRPIELDVATTYGLAFKFPEGWNRPTDGWGCAIAQLGYPLLKYTNIGLFASGDFVGLEMHTGHIEWEGRKPSAEANAKFDYYMKHTDRRGKVIPASRFKVGVWHSLLIEIRWATGPTGYVRAWHHVEGNPSWTKTVDLEGIPTMQWGYGIDGNFYGKDGKDTSGEAGGLSDKVGAYRDDSPNPFLIYNDGLVLATSPSITASRLVAPPFTPVVRGTRLRPIGLGRPYRAQFEVRGGVLPIRWSISRGRLPPGIGFSKTTGVLAGRARTMGRWRIVVTASDALGARASRALTLRVRR